MNFHSTMGFVSLAFFLVVRGSAFAQAERIPDPCKLLSANQLRDALNITGPMNVAPTPLIPTIRLELDDTFFGSLGVAMKTFPESVKNSLVCLGNAGDVELRIRVTALDQALADEAERRRVLPLLEQKCGYKANAATYGTIGCQEIFGPATDMLGRDPQFGNLTITSMTCDTDRNGWWIGVVALPRQPEKNLPFTMDNLHSLVELAAQRLRGGPPTPKQSAITQGNNVPAGFISCKIRPQGSSRRLSLSSCLIAGGDFEEYAVGIAQID
jgi:hypothetical protein